MSATTLLDHVFSVKTFSSTLKIKTFVKYIEASVTFLEKRNPMVTALKVGKCSFPVDRKLRRLGKVYFVDLASGLC